MNRIKNSNLFRIISLVLIAAFITLDVSWAYPPESNAQTSTLATPSLLQQQPVDIRFQQSIFSQAALLGSVCSIGKYLLEDKQPLKYLDQVLSKELGEAVKGIDLSRVTVKDGVVLIPYEINSIKRIIRIALKDSVSSKDLTGYEWVVADKYVIKDLPEEYKEPVMQIAQEPKISISEPIKGAAAQIVDLMAKRDELPQRADLLVVFGSEDARVAEQAAKLFNNSKGAITKILVAGKYRTQFEPLPNNPDFGKDKDGNVVEAEALIYKRILMENGVPEDVILVEKNSQEMIGNGVKSVELLNLKGLSPKTIIFMHAPLLQLRGSLSLRDALAKAGMEAQVYDYAAPVAVDPDKKADSIIRQAGRLTDDITQIIGQEKLAEIKDLLETLKAEKQVPPELSQKEIPGASGKLLFINPFTIVFGVAVLTSVFLAVKDFTSVHPVIAWIVGLGIGITIFISWRVFFPLNWHIFWLKYGADYMHIKGLTKIGPPAVPILIKKLSDESDISMRRTIIGILGGIKDSRAVDPLIELLKDKSDDIRCDAISALGSIKDARAVEPLIELLKDKCDRIRYQAAWSLGSIKDARAIQPLMIALNDKNADVRVCMLSALGMIGDNRASTRVAVFLSDIDFRIQSEAVKTLDLLGWKYTNKREEILYYIAKKNSDQLINIGEAAVPYLIENLPYGNYHQYESKVIFAKNILIKIGPPAVPILIKKLSDESDISMRRTIIGILGGIKDSRAVDPLIELLKDKNDHVRYDAINALGSIEDASAIEPLIKILIDDNSNNRYYAARVLSEIKDLRLSFMENYLRAMTCGFDYYKVLTQPEIIFIADCLKKEINIDAQYTSYTTHTDYSNDPYGSDETVVDSPAILAIKMDKIQEPVQNKLAISQAHETAKVHRLAPQYALDVSFWNLEVAPFDLSKEGMAVTNLDRIQAILAKRSWLWNNEAVSNDARDKILGKIKIIQARIPAIISTLYENNIISAKTQLVSIYLVGSYPWIELPNDIDIVVVVEGDRGFDRVHGSTLSVKSREIIPGLETSFELVGLDTLKRAARGEEFDKAKVVRRRLIEYSGSALLAGVDIFDKAKIPVENYMTMRDDLITNAELANWDDIKNDPAKVEKKRAWRAREVKALEAWIEIKKQEHKDGSVTLRSFNPFAIMLGAAAFTSVFSTVKNFVFAHPIIAGIATLGIGIAAFFMVWCFGKRHGEEALARFDTEGKKTEKIDSVILNIVNTDIAFVKDGEKVVFPKDMLARLKHMADLRRNMRVEIEAVCTVTDGVVTDVTFPDKSDKMAVLTTGLPQETIMNTSDYFSYTAAALANLRYRLKGIDISKPYTEKEQKALVSAFRTLVKSMKEYKVTIELYMPSKQQRIGFDVDAISHLSFADLADALSNTTHIGTEWIVCKDLDNYEFGERLIKEKEDASYREDKSKIFIHAHPLGYASPPSAVTYGGKTLGDIYVDGFFEGSKNGLILDTADGEELFIFFEKDRSNEQAYHKIFGKFWRLGQSVLEDLRAISMVPYLAAESAPQMPNSGESTSLTAVGASVMEELATRKKMSFQELFSLVQSKVPSAMENLTQALEELKPLCEKPGLLVDEMSVAVKQMKEKYKLSDNETKILWLALTGPGQGSGRIERISAIRDCLSNIMPYLAKRDELPQEADLLMVLGSNNMQVPIEAARLFKNLKIKKILVSGFGPADKKGTAMMPEAHIFRDKLIAEGVPAEAIETEDQSTSTKENIEFSKKILEEKKIPHDTVILITFPIGQRIAGETFKKQFSRDAINYAAYLPSLLDTVEKDLIAEAESIYMHLTRLTYYGPSGKAEIGAIDIPAEICQTQEKLRERLLSVETEDMVNSDKLDYDHARAKALIKIKLTEQSVRYKFNKVSPWHIEKAMEIMAAGNDFIINLDSLDIEEVKMEVPSKLALTGPGQGIVEDVAKGKNLAPIFVTLMVNKDLQGLDFRDVEKAIASGKTAIAEVSVDWARKIKETYPDEVYSIFISPLSEEQIKERMREKGQTREEVIFEEMAGRQKERAEEKPTSEEKQLARAQAAVAEMARQNEYDAVIVSSELQDLKRDDIRWAGDEGSKVVSQFMSVIDNARKSGKKLILYSGPSATGKTPLWNKVKQKHEDEFSRIVLYTTRSRREDEKDEVDYYFRSVEQLKDLEKTLNVPSLTENVELPVNNERTKFIDAGQKITGDIDKNMMTAEIKEKISKAISAIEQLDQKSVSSEIKASIEPLKKNLDQFEADGCVGSLIFLARRAQREDQKLIIGLETDWIPGINERGHGSQHDAINLLLIEIRSIGQLLKDLGLDNVEIVEGSGQGLASALLDKADNTKTDLSNVIVLASSETINSGSFDPLRSTATEKRAFLAGIDASEIAEFYEANKDAMKSSGKQLQIRIMTMLSITLDLALGKEPPQLPIIVSYDKNQRLVLFLPKAELLDYEAIKSHYAGERKALQAA